MTPTDQRVDKLETSLRETIDEMQQQIAGLTEMQLFLRRRVLAIEAEQQIQGAEQTAQAVSELSAWQASADDPPA